MISPMKTFIKSLGSAVKLWPGFEHIGEKLEDPLMADKIVDDMIETLTTEKSCGFNVLNHGDFHIRNLMFKEGAKGREVLFLDFQIPMFNSPGFDLNSMFSGCGDYEARERKEEVLYMYHQILVKSLTRYGFKGKIPTAIDVQVEMLRTSSLG